MRLEECLHLPQSIKQGAKRNQAGVVPPREEVGAHPAGVEGSRGESDIAGTGVGAGPGAPDRDLRHAEVLRDGHREELSREGKKCTL